MDYVKLKDDLDALGVEVLLISTDSPERNTKFRSKFSIPANWPLLTDEVHEVADRYGIPIGRKHPKAWGTKDGFIQPAVLAYKGEEEVFTFIQIPKFSNLWGAARRPEPAQVLAAIEPKLAAAPKTS